MKYELNIYELGQLLKKVEENYGLEILTKMTLSGGWMTMTGKASVVSVPEDKIVIKGNNIITLNIKDNNLDGNLLKITGAKDKKFNVDIAPTKYKELKSNGLNINKTKINENECKIRIDEDIIFTIRNVSVDELSKLI